MSQLARYLARYAEPEAVWADGLISQSYRNVLVVPCYDEAFDDLARVIPEAAAELLVVVVVNVPSQAEPAARQRTQALLQHLGGAGSRSLVAARRVDLLVVDRVNQPIPAKQGVGLARKIGADCAAQLISAGNVSVPWIYCTDADAQLPSDYFTTATPERGGLIFNFRHAGDDDELHRKAQLYELHLRYYQKMLAECGSRYAFHALGSTLALHATDYAIVRGFPKRNAGEDFHLLNKLAKVAPINSLATPTIQLRGRRSQRTPFGTGAALAKIGADAQYASYAPASFALLSEVLAALEEAGTMGHLNVQGHAAELLEELGGAAFLAKAAQQYSPGAQLQRALREWFDALKTLRFIHACRRYHPDTPLLAALAAQFACPPHRESLLAKLSCSAQVTGTVGTGSQP